MWKDYIMNYSDAYEWMDKIANQNPVIITVAVNGGVQGKEAHSELPETIDEIAQSVYEAYNAGASVAHIHGRNPDCLWKCTDKAEVYREINAKIRAKCPDIIINNTTGGGLNTTMEDRINCLEALPEVASLNMGPDMSKLKMPARPNTLMHPREELNFDECIPFTYKFINRLAEEMLKKGIKPEMEMYHPGQYWVSRDLIKNGYLKEPFNFQFIMGYQTSSFPTPLNIINLVRELPQNSVFGVAGIGKFQWHVIATGMILGGNVRVGLEDNIYLKKGVKLANNAAAVEKAVRIARELNREVATPAQAREILGLDLKPRLY
jgi:3-keto-5-aminohexanoate cleavage enzyme